jgi:hypothetical protein
VQVLKHTYFVRVSAKFEQGVLMIKKISILFWLVFTFAIFAEAQTTQNANTSELLARLPDSEAVMFVDAKRLFADALPLLTANNPAQLAEINRQIERFRQQTGNDARDFDVMAVSLDFSPKITSLFPPQGTLTLDPVILARSSNSNAAQILATARRASQTSIGGKPLPVQTRDRKYKNREIFTVRVDETTRVFGLIDLKNKEVSIVALDDKTVAIGNLDAVRDAIAAYDGGKRVDAKIAQLAVRNPNAAMGFAGIVPGYVSSRIKFGTAELSRPFQQMRGFYGALEIGQSNFVLTTNLQTIDANAATDLSRTINLIKDFVPGLINQLPAILGKAAGVAIARAENVTVNQNGDGVQIRIELAVTGAPSSSE